VIFGGDFCFWMIPESWNQRSFLQSISRTVAFELLNPQVAKVALMLFEHCLPLVEWNGRRLRESNCRRQ
jgi:hypothetical protein